MTKRKKCLYFTYFLLKSLLFFTVPLYSAATEEKGWNFMVYMAANNNLHKYAIANMKEMQKIGTNKNINLFTQIDNYGKKEVTRYLINQGNSKKLSTVTNYPEGLSGTAENLFTFVKDIIENYPAKHNALIVWNHGSGAKDPHIWGRVPFHNRNQQFYLNKSTNLYEINKEIVRGIGFNDIGHTYLNDKDIKKTLTRISKELLGGKKIDIIGMDACHMAMIEVCSQIHKNAKYLVGSQEIIPGYGWNYTTILKPFLEKSMTPSELSQHIVYAYDIRYNNLFTDLTLSAIELENYKLLENNVDSLATILLALLETNKPTLSTLISIRNNSSETKDFFDPDYIDLVQFYKTLQKRIPKIPATEDEKQFILQLNETIAEGISLFDKIILKNAVGQHAIQAHGLSIYFPKRILHTSYTKTSFAKKTNWGTLLLTYLKKRQKSFIDSTP